MPQAVTERATLAAMNISELLISYLNWSSRFISASPRRVHISEVLSAKRPLADAALEAGLTQILALIAEGGDLTPHLSRGVKISIDARPRNGQGRRDLDLMLNDWGVHHLHLSTQVMDDGFVARTGPVLFAIFRADDAFLIDIIDHSNGQPHVWTQKHILEIMARQWPNEQLILEMKGALPSRDLTDYERQALRDNHVNASIIIDGRGYMSRFGLTASGIATQTTLKVNHLLRHVEIMERDLRQRSGPTWENLSNAGIQLADPERVHFAFLSHGHAVTGYALFDEIGQTLISIS